ncbi:hypothetical protein NQZ68_019728 [Dissostichus eleginoides]|nr:hypothetical protein NQZ68_019728 [Dissostichus eleginoides]
MSEQLSLYTRGHHSEKLDRTRKASATTHAQFATETSDRRHGSWNEAGRKHCRESKDMRSQVNTDFYRV